MNVSEDRRSGRSDRLIFQRNVMCRNDRKDWTEDEVTK